VIFLNCLAFTGFSQGEFPVPAGNPKQLFYLQRSPNSNTIVCELNYKDSVLDEENPVHVFWIEYMDKGQRSELTGIQRNLAYGIKVNKLSDKRYEMNFVSYKKYKMYLEPGSDNKFSVYVMMKDKKLRLSGIYIKVSGGTALSPNIEFVEVTGFDLETGGIVKDRFKP